MRCVNNRVHHLDVLASGSKIITTISLLGTLMYSPNYFYTNSKTKMLI